MYSCDSLVPKDLQEEYRFSYEEGKVFASEQRKQAKNSEQSPEIRDLTSKSFAHKKAPKDEGGFESDEDHDDEASSSKVQNITVDRTDEPISAEPGPSTSAPSPSPVIAQSATKVESDSDTEDEDEMVIRRKSPVKETIPSEAPPTNGGISSTSDKAGDESAAGVKRSLPPEFASDTVKRPQTAAEMSQRRKALKKSKGF